MIFTDASTQGWGSHMGNSQISGVWTPSECRLHISVFELKAVMLALQHWVSVLQGHQVMITADNTTVVCSLHVYQQTGLDPFPHPVVAGIRSVSMATDSRYSHPGQTHSGLPQCNSRPVTTEWSLHSEVVNLIFELWGTLVVDICHSPKQASSPVYVSSSTSTGNRCSVTRLAGAVIVHIFTVFPAQQSHSEAQDDPEGRDDTDSPLVAVTTMVSTLTTSVCGPLVILSVLPRPTVTTGIFSCSKSYYLQAWRLSCSTTKQQHF